MYDNDTTVVKLGEMEQRVEVHSGIRQGCAVSTFLFKLITYRIIEEMSRRGYMYKMGDININQIWFADDNTLIAGSIKAAEHNIKLMK